MKMNIRIPEKIADMLVPITNRWDDEKETIWAKHFEVIEIHSKGLFTNRKFFLRTKEVI